MTQQKLPRASAASRRLCFCWSFWFLMMKTDSFSSLRAVRDGAHPPYPVSFFLQLDPPLRHLQRAFHPRALSPADLVPGDPDSHVFPGTVLLRLDLPAGFAEPLLQQLEIRAQAGLQRIESNRYKKWQTLKYYILVALLVSALFGGAASG